MTVFDTIAAVSTPRGKGGVALLRISGPEALTICEKIFKPKNGKDFIQYAKENPRKELYGTIYTYEENELFPTDDGLAVFFPCPHSFTGEDVVEICCHGGILLTETILSSLFVAGARPAVAGEFTKRAFINGKIGLSSAEALGKLLEAKTTNQLALAHTALTGKTEVACQEIYNSIAKVLSSVYAKIDYPDEDLADMSREEMVLELTSCLDLAKKLASTYKTGHAIAEGIPTAICGRPNVGKSTLYNALVGHDAAIVTDIAGTTRDILSETVAFGKLTLQLFDTAGIHETCDIVEQIGVERAEKVLRDAELIFAVFDASVSPTEEDLELIEELKKVDAPIFYLLNKGDKGICEDYKKLLPSYLVLSAKNGEGLETLKEKVETIFLEGNINIREDAVLLNARQDASVNSCISSLTLSIDTLKKGYPFDLCCTDAERAMQSIAEVDGRAVSEDIVAQIFSHFCVGK